MDASLVSLLSPPVEGVVGQPEEHWGKPCFVQLLGWKPQRKDLNAHLNLLKLNLDDFFLRALHAYFVILIVYRQTLRQAKGSR